MLLKAGAEASNLLRQVLILVMVIILDGGMVSYEDH